MSFSGDKLLGGPQAGIIVGAKPLIARLKKNPLARALRLDKMTLAALEATLRLYLNPENARREIPTLRMLTETADEVRVRTKKLASMLKKALPADACEVSIVEEISRAGGGALPMCDIPTYCVQVKFLQGDALSCDRHLVSERLAPRCGTPEERHAALRWAHCARRGRNAGNRVRMHRVFRRDRPMKNHDLVLGTAGHIDHGKSSLILALTGTDPDRLSEEKQRGITIEPRLRAPFSRRRHHLRRGRRSRSREVRPPDDLEPTGIDMALLCIAADDGVMPQTTEHLAVLELLRIPTLVVALTKTDLVDDEWVEFMIDEVKGRLAGGPYENAEIIAVSSRTGEGRRPEGGAWPGSESDKAPKSFRQCSPAYRPRFHNQRRRHSHHGNALGRRHFDR